MMDLITAEEAQKLLDECDAETCLTCAYARTVVALLDARAELAQARAEAQAAVALMVERAVAQCTEHDDISHNDFGDGWRMCASSIASAIRALAPEDAIAEVERVRAERNAALADVARFQEERTYVIGANDGWDAAVEQGEASPAVEKAMVRFWKKLAETHNERADRLAAELAAANAREAGNDRRNRIE